MQLPVLTEPEQLAALLGDEALIVVDLSNATSYAEAHIPGAIHLDYAMLVRGEKPAPGLLPDSARLSAIGSHIGLTADQHVVAYDNEGSGRASRLLWTLHVLGHYQVSVLNGGIHSWTDEGCDLTAESSTPEGSDYTAHPGDDAIADLDYIRARLGSPEIGLLDARTPEEFTGTTARALRGGRIPRAFNLNWLDTIDRNRALRLKPATTLQAMLNAGQLTTDKEIITYCQTHHRSAHSYMMLKSLGYPNVRGYAGSWSEWGNHPDTPVEVG